MIWQGLNLVERFRYRHIPGPRPRFMLGNGLDIYLRFKFFIPQALGTWGAEYGPVFKWWLGLQPIVVSAVQE